MKYVVVGSYVPTEYETQISDLSIAGNHFLWNFIDALEQNDQEVARVSYLGISVPDKVKAELVKKGGYCFKNSNIINSIKECHCKIADELSSADCLVVYNVVYAWLFASRIARKQRKKSILLLADFSDMDSYGGIKGKIYAWLQRKAIRRYDLVIGLSENIQKYLHFRQKFLCMEGGINQEVFDYFDTTEQADEYTFMYAGLLEPVTGVEMLLEAANKLDGDFRLFISGRGSLSSLVTQYAEKDRRIVYLGCPDYKEYLHYLKTATVLINPRNMSMPENSNNFPSKIMEYLATGKPIISTKFPGWQRFEDCVTFCDSSVEGLMSSMERVRITIDPFCEYNKNRKKAENYLWKKQVKRILDIL